MHVLIWKHRALEGFLAQAMHTSLAPAGLHDELAHLISYGKTDVGNRTLWAGTLSFFILSIVLKKSRYVAPVSHALKLLY